MLPSHFLPIQVVLPRKEIDYRADPVHGGSSTLFCDVTPTLRKTLTASVDRIRTHFSESFKVQPTVPAVARVELRPRAAAKSHKPWTLFNEDTCPIIGGERAGEMLVAVTDKGLDRLARKIDTDRGQKVKSHISTIQALRPYVTEDALEANDAAELAKASSKTNTPIRLRLFRHESDQINAKIDLLAETLAEQEKIAAIEKLDYGIDTRVYAVRGASAKAIRAMANFVGTQSIGLFPAYQIVRQASHIIGSADDKLFPPPAANGDYGVVGIIDSGTFPDNKRLQAYVVDRYNWIKNPKDQHNEHGSFVAGLIANARWLNHGSELFPSVRSKIVDVVAIDKSGGISEYDLITVIDDAVRRFPEVKVWNLSLSQNDATCKDGRFSLLGIKLDSIAKQRGVLFVIAAGNYNKTPLRSWKPTADIGDDDRICPPADSVRGLTVGSLAHKENESSCVKVHDPSPFTRRGPAPHFYNKPEVSHYGGNCDPNGSSIQTGVVSIASATNIGENIGTSFAAPSVSNIAANMFRELAADERLSPTLVKAMIVHSALVRGGKPDKDEVRYRGFGTPGDLHDVLNCTQSSATLIFHAELEDRVIYEKVAFPMPLCLQPKTGLRAEVFMTLAYDPPTDGRYGVEYCRSNVTASLGTMKVNHETGKEEYTPQLESAPEGITKGYEERLVKEGHKWSPLKLYHREFERGPLKAKWRLHMELLNRHGVRCKEKQKVTLLVTIRDPNGTAFVYESLIREMNRLAWAPQNLRIQSRLRGRSRN
ncbi:MAG: S8 family peptidase [Pirellulales bacterium]